MSIVFMTHNPIEILLGLTWYVYAESRRSLFMLHILLYSIGLEQIEDELIVSIQSLNILEPSLLLYYDR